MPTFAFEGSSICAEDDETVLSALLRHDIEVQSGCRAGACQSCLMRSSGSIPASAQAGLDDTLVEQGAFLSCQARAGTVESVERLSDAAFPRYDATLTGRRWVNEDVLLLSLGVPGWSASPGRFVRLLHPSGVSRPYSLAAPAWEPSSLVQLHVRIIPGGQMSGLLAKSQVGDSLAIEGPFGKCAYRRMDGTEPILLIGSGTGLAPLYGIVTDALRHEHTGQIHLYHGAADSSRVYFREELETLGREFTNFRYVPCADQVADSRDRKGSPLTLALEDLPSLDRFKVYLCGHPDLVRVAQKKCFLAGASIKDIAADPFVPA